MKIAPYCQQIWSVSDEREMREIQCILLDANGDTP